MATLFDPSRAEFSNQAHQAARRLIYPQIFRTPFDKLEFEEEGTLLGAGERGQVLDGEMAIDRVVKVPAEGFRAPLLFTIQERFRELKWESKKDVTITEWNETTDLPSEMYKIAADLFVYGYFDESQCDFLDVIAFWVGPAKAALVFKDLPWGRDYHPRKRQPFITLEFDDLLPYCAWWKNASEDTGLNHIPYPPSEEIRAWQRKQIEAYHEEQEKEQERIEKTHQLQDKMAKKYEKSGCPH